MKKLLSLSLLLSLSMASFSPLLAAAQQANQQNFTKSSGFQAALKKVRGQQLTPNEQAAYETLRKRVGIAAIVTTIAVLLGMGAYQVNNVLNNRALRERPGRRRPLLPGEELGRPIRRAPSPEEPISEKSVEQRRIELENRLSQYKLFLHLAEENKNHSQVQEFTQQIEELQKEIDGLTFVKSANKR